MAANDNPWTTDPEQQNQQPQQPQSQSGQNPFTSGMNRDQVRQAVTDYYSSRGVAPQGNSIDYWTDKYNEFGNKDPNYYMRYLSNAEEFTGGPQQTAQAMWGGGGGMSGGYGGSSMSYTPWTADPRSGQLFNMLMGRATQTLTPNAKDPVIAAQTNAFGAQQERANRNYINQLAESEGPQANLSMEKRMGAEKAAQATGALQAQLMGNEVAARRQEIQAALSQMGNMLSDEQKMQLQKELAYLSNDQFLRDLGLRAQQQAWNQDAYSSGLMG